MGKGESSVNFGKMSGCFLCRNDFLTMRGSEETARKKERKRGREKEGKRLKKERQGFELPGEEEHQWLLSK